MFGTRHSVSVWPTRGDRKYQFRCSCGATGWETSTRARAREMGEQHKAKAGR